MTMINITSIRRLLISTAALGLLFLAAAVFRFILPGGNNDGAVPTEVIQGPDGKKNINVTVTLPQIKKEITPERIRELLSRTRVADADNGGLRLVDFEDNSVLARYGFRKGDIIKEIDGQGVNTEKDAIKACDELEKDIFKDRDAKQINIALDRDGEDININFRIPEFVPEKVCYTMSLQKRRKGR